MHTSKHSIKVFKARRKAGKTTIAIISLGRHFKRTGKRHFKRLESSCCPPGLGQGEQLLFRRLDLVARGELGITHLGGGGDVAADADEFAAKGEVVDRPGVIRRLGGRWRAIHHVGEIAYAAQLLERRVALELLGEQGGVGQLAAAHVQLDGGEQASVERLVEMLGLERVGQPFEGAVVVQQGAQEGLLGFDVGGRLM